MNQEIEIEFKNLLMEEEYSRLLEAYGFNKNNAKRQTNHYFETTQMELKQKGSALRIRKKGNSYTLTLKQPYKDDLLETHQQLTEEEFFEAIKNSVLPNGDVLDQISKLLEKNQHTFTYLGELTTDRIEKTLDEGTLVLDKSYYFQVTDFELEFECVDKQTGYTYFQNTLTTYEIPIRETPNKIKRFYEEKMKQK
ncbi:CYTH domain-containing protein [Evansella sp. AB-rgal1]|uniref:CYTH domain-containing protein n=1 Tax=Evansella sp. AB-rgal1 TaxID=3242696 RepID=UPI00359E98D4